MSTYTDEQLQQLIPFIEKLAEYNPGSGYDLSKALISEMLHLRSLLREVCEAAEVYSGAGLESCRVCFRIPHAPDCPVGIAKKFLG
jgi:hypothetical protein